jgi:hypothetical protein
MSIALLLGEVFVFGSSYRAMSQLELCLMGRLGLRIHSRVVLSVTQRSLPKSAIEFHLWSELTLVLFSTLSTHGCAKHATIPPLYPHQSCPLLSST